MEYNFKYSLTEDEFADFSAYTNWLSPQMKKHRIVYILKSVSYFYISFIAFIAIEFYFNPLQKHNYTIFKSVGVIGGLLFVLYLVFQTPFSIKAKAKKMLLKEENKHFLFEADLFLNDNGIASSDILSTNNYKWSSIVKFCITQRCFYLYTNSIQALIIPKRLFKSQIDIDQFEKFLSEKVPLSSSFRSIGI